MSLKNRKWDERLEDGDIKNWTSSEIKIDAAFWWAK